MKHDAAVVIDDEYRLRVMSKRCDECLYSEARIVTEERAFDLMQDCENSGRYFLCHKSEQPTVCRGFFDSGVNALCRYASGMGAVLPVEPSKGKR